MGCLSISLNHLQLPLSVFCSFQCIGLWPPWSLAHGSVRRGHTIIPQGDHGSSGYSQTGLFLYLPGPSDLIYTLYDKTAIINITLSLDLWVILVNYWTSSFTGTPEAWRPEHPLRFSAWSGAALGSDANAGWTASGLTCRTCSWVSTRWYLLYVCHRHVFPHTLRGCE